MFNRGGGSGAESKRIDESFYRGIVIKNDDPLKLNRVKVYIPELSNQPFEEWLGTLDEINIKAPGVDSWSDPTIVDKIAENIPWAEPCYPLVGESGSSRSAREGDNVTATLSDGNYAEGYVEDPENLSLVDVGGVTQFDPPIKLSNYGYASDSTPDTYSSNGIGHRNNRLTDEKSAAISKSLATSLGLQHNDWFRISTTKGTLVLQYGDTVPSYDKRTGPLPPTIDVYRRNNGNNSWGGKITSFQKLGKSPDIPEETPPDKIATSELPSEPPIEDAPSLLPPVDDNDVNTDSSSTWESPSLNGITRDGVLSQAPAQIYEFIKTKISDVFGLPNDSSSMKANPYSHGFAPQNHSNKPKGAIGIPEVGSKVWVFHYMGDLNFPVYFGVTQDLRGLSVLNRTDNQSGASSYYPNDFENK